MYKFSKWFARVVLVVFAVITVFGSFVGIGQAVRVSAANPDNNFDETNVYDDLSSSTINGQPFSVLDYPFDATGLIKNPAIINFVEYCYSFRKNMQSNYGLYIYFYNPQALDINVSSIQNKIQMAVKYNSNGLPADYEKFDIVFCSRSEGTYRNLFYKFRVKDKIGADGKTVLERVNSNERRYDVSGIELIEYGKPNAHEYLVGCTYKFSGYVKGYGADTNAESDLAVSVNNLETIELRDVRKTFYRTSSSSLGVGHQNQLDSVYFAVDDYYFEQYGNLQKIKAEWWEYKTAPIFITQNVVLYDYLKNYIGVDIGSSFNSSVDYRLFCSAPPMPANGYIHFYWNDNIYSHGSNPSRLCYILPTNGVSASNYTLSSAELTKYIEGYDKSFFKGYLPVRDGKNISADLFQDVVDNGRDRGPNIKEFDSDDKFNILSYDSSNNGWRRFWDYFGNWGVDTSSGFYNLSPIAVLANEDFSGNNNQVSSRIAVHENEVDTLKAFRSKPENKNKRTVLFRFATTDYYSYPVSFQQHSGLHLAVNNQAYWAQETVFYNFDIIQLTFNKDGVFKVIPVVMNPIDIINDITPPLIGEGNDWWKYVLMALALILLILLIIICWKPISFVIGIILWPFKKFFGAIRKAFKSGKKDKRE